MATSPPKIQKAAGIIIQERRLLVERSKGKDYFISPGGSIEKGETPEQALVRELEEEFTIIVQAVDLEHFGRYEAVAANHPDRQVVMEVFFVKRFRGDCKPSSEVEQLAWVNSKNEDRLPLGSIFEKEVIPELVRRNLID